MKDPIAFYIEHICVHAEKLFALLVFVCHHQILFYKISLLRGQGTYPETATMNWLLNG